MRASCYARVNAGRSAQERVDEGAGVERREVVGTLTEADELAPVVDAFLDESPAAPQ